MGLFVQTNASSLNAQRNLTKTGRDFERVYERLSSGMRINSAKDDAAGLAISTRFTSQVRGLNTAVRNSNDSISLVQTIEGALQESTTILQRMRELSVQSANDINTDADRRSIDSEMKQLISELNRIGDTTSFNNHKVLNGSFIQKFMHVGANANQNLAVTVKDARATALGRTAVQQSSNVSTEAFSKAAGTILVNDITIRNTTDADDMFSTSANSGSAIAKANAINNATEFTGVTARVLATRVDAGRDADAPSDVTSGTLDEQTFIKINNEIITGFAVTDDDSSGELVAQINAFTDKTGVVARLDENYRMTLEAVDGRNIHVETSNVAAETITGLKEDVYTGRIELESDGAFFVTSGIGAGDDGFGSLGFDNAQVVAVNSAKSSVSQVDTLTRESSNRAIQVIDRALEQISANRADLGALHNRLESTINNLSSISENIAASRGRILDADFAAESANMAKTSILQQAGTSILAQANQAGQAALTLLG